jgi:hypothetical protein
MAEKCWKGPDVLVIGWIPFAMDSASAPGFPPGPGATLLFQSGNPDPPIAFAGHAGFTGWLHPSTVVGTKEYRAALYLKDIVAEFNSGSEPVIRAADGPFVGYTPVRMFIGGANVAVMVPQFSQYLRGTGTYHPPVPERDPGGQWIGIRYRAEFKLSKLPNLISKVLVGAWAPYAWCEIVYRVYASGKVEVDVEGSAIPSQRLYIDWALPPADSMANIQPVYDMRTASRDEVLGFVETQGWGCKPAPGRPRLTWRGQAEEC